MRESASCALLMVAVCAASCTITGGPGLENAGDEVPCDGGPHDGEAIPLDSIVGGDFAPLAGYTGVGGRAQLARQQDGNTRVELQLTGVPAGITMTAHVHAASCAFQGGGHYKIDPAVMDTLEANELWIHLETTADGVATASAQFPHLARGDALSVVLHDPASGSKMACADLADDAADATVELGGFFAPFAQAEEIDSWISGAVSAFRSPDATDLYLGIDGLDPEQTYAAHVHALPCDILDGGGHYKIDPTVVDTIEENELWLDTSDTASGSLWSETWFDHGARADAQSIVLHRIAGDAKLKVACADLVRFDAAPLTTTGDSALLPAGTERAPDLWATAAMTRTLEGATDVWLLAGGLAADTRYPVHVHDLPCAIKDGGAHYLVDRAAGAGEANELWLPIDADQDGNGLAEIWVPHLARPEARSLVIHDPTDNARLACIDLR